MVRKSREKRVGLGPQEQAGLGHQLTRRLQSGAISQGQAQQTAGQRQMLEKAFGSEWRRKVFGDRGYIQRTRLAKAKEPENARVQALNTALMKRRRQMLARAEQKLG